MLMLARGRSRQPACLIKIAGSTGPIVADTLGVILLGLGGFMGCKGDKKKDAAASS